MPSVARNCLLSLLLASLLGSGCTTPNSAPAQDSALLRVASNISVNVSGSGVALSAVDETAPGSSEYEAQARVAPGYYDLVVGDDIQVKGLAIVANSTTTVQLTRLSGSSSISFRQDSATRGAVTLRSNSPDAATIRITGVAYSASFTVLDYNTVVVFLAPGSYTVSGIPGTSSSAVNVSAGSASTISWVLPIDDPPEYDDI